MESETSATHNNHHVTAGDGASRSRWSNGWLGRLARAMAPRQPGRWARAMPRGMARAMARRMARGMALGNADDFCVRCFLDNVSANFAKQIVRKNCTQNCTQNCPRNCPHHSENCLRVSAETLGEIVRGSPLRRSCGGLEAQAQGCPNGTQAPTART